MEVYLLMGLLADKVPVCICGAGRGGSFLPYSDSSGNFHIGWADTLSTGDVLVKCPPVLSGPAMPACSECRQAGDGWN